jgi:hypothetical protein
MTPQQEKAKELFNKLNDKIISFEDVRLRGNGFEMTKQCALIAVDEILDVLWHTHKNETEFRYYQQVKTEIEKL